MLDRNRGLLTGLCWLLAGCALQSPANIASSPPAPPVPASAPAASAARSPAPVVVSSAPSATPNASLALAAEPSPKIRLLFTGDINPGRCPAQIALAHGDFTLPYRHVADDLRSADLTIGSLDGALSDLSPPSPCPQTMNLIGPARTVEGLTYAGFDVISVSTNHAKDCGRLGWGCDDRSFSDTLGHLAGAGLLAVGGGDTLAEALSPVYVDRQGVRFGFIGVTSVGPETWATDERPGTAPLSSETLPALIAAIAEARAQSDVVIVLPQWGVEYAEQPMRVQREWAAAMIAAGAALVIGNQAHVVQPVEAFGGVDGHGGVTAYALGNFVFDQGPWRTRQGVVFEAMFEGSRLSSWRLRPIHIRSLHQPYWAEAGEAATILARVAAVGTSMP